MPDGEKLEQSDRCLLCIGSGREYASPESSKEPRFAKNLFVRIDGEYCAIVDCHHCEGTGLRMDPPIDPGELCVDCEISDPVNYERCREPCDNYSKAGRKFDRY